MGPCCPGGLFVPRSARGQHSLAGSNWGKGRVWGCSSAGRDTGCRALLQAELCQASTSLIQIQDGLS